MKTEVSGWRFTFPSTVELPSSVSIWSRKTSAVRIAQGCYGVESPMNKKNLDIMITGDNENVPTQERLRW
jgi:hypothetical protein